MNKNTDVLTDKPQAIDTGLICLYRTCSPYPDHDLGFNWMNFDYPYYHSHDYWEIILVSSGKIQHTVNGQQQILETGACCLLRPIDSHKLNSLADVPCQHMSFLITCDYMKTLLSTYSPNAYNDLINKSGALRIRLPEYKLIEIVNAGMNCKSYKLSIEQKVYCAKIIVHDLLNSILKDANSTLSNNPEWLTNFLFILNNPYLDTSNMNTLANYTPYSYSHLAHVFKSITGRTIIEYCNHVKIFHAQELLKSSDMSVSEICDKLHFESFSYFHRLFKRITNVSPSDYRKSNTPPPRKK